jgi:SAM-dependent methyltransferase
MAALATDRLRPWSDRATVALVDDHTGLPAIDGSADRFVADYVFDLLSSEATVAALADARRVLVPGGLLCAAGLTDGEGGVAALVSRAWRWVWDRWPAVVGGCRPTRLPDALAPGDWVVRHRRSVAAWGVASEAVIAARR